MVLPVADQNIAIGHHGDPFESLELGVIRSPASESTQETAVRMENLDTVVTRIGYTNVALIIDSDTAGELELALQVNKKGQE